MEQLGERQQATYELVGVTRREMGEIRSFLMGDIAPRVTAAEAAKTPAQAAAGHGLKMGQYILVATGALGVVAQVAHLFIPSLEGPIQTVLGIIKGLQ